MRGQIGGVGDDGGFTGDSKLESQQGFGEGNRGSECLNSRFLFGAGPGKLEDVVDVSVQGSACVEVGGKRRCADFAQRRENRPGDGCGRGAPSDERVRDVRNYGGDGAVDVDDAWGAAPRAQEEDGRVPLAVERPLYGNVCFDGVEKHLEVPKNSD